MAQSNGTGPFSTSSPGPAVLPSSAGQPSSNAPSSANGSPGVSTSIFSQAQSTVIASSAPGSSGAGAQSNSGSPSTSVITSVAVASATNSAGQTTDGPSTILITSTIPPAVFPSDSTTRTTSTSSSSTKSGSPALATTGSSADSGSGLSAGGKIAVAVVVPVVAVALIVLAAILLWRRRKAKKEAEDLRRKEVEEYGFNPNHDPTLPAVGGSSSIGDDPSQMTEVDGAGYRGWGTTSTNRKPSTTLSSGNGPVGIARSTSGSDNDRLGGGTPTKNSDGNSNDPLVGSPPHGRPLTGDSETIGALGAVPSTGNQQNMHRGPSNASSAYSGVHGARSETSGDGNIPNSAPNQQYYSEGMYFDEGMPQHGPYGDGSYGGGQPVIRDVPARRNTRIENPSVFPQQSSAGIAQNF